MNRFLTLAAALVCSCVFMQSARAGGAAPSFGLGFTGLESSFDGSFTTVTFSVVATVGSDVETIGFDALLVAPAAFNGGFMVAPGTFPGTLGDLSAADLCLLAPTTECLFPASFSAAGPAGGTFGTTATLTGEFPTVTQNANFSVPEPASIALLGIALLGLGIARRKAAR